MQRERARRDHDRGTEALSRGKPVGAEAFKPGTGPNLITSVIGVNSNAFNGLDGGTGQPSPGFNGPDNGDGPQPPADINNDGGDGGNNSGRGFLFGRGGLF